ncbi:MAG: hypothetical protein AVDCRST_MAG34-1991 [uncultured Nocardioidaceae bacterium]|uniref:AB hydrolase-1 domain-containing protein n=1 Tax=uncultured Nocardioidaceae bacterium TaxID=253824 RepID=A0A6J4MAD5_9ACTN|nr:MAG: hypothetical protein AVDCRST_MAG34-1991 [uncultured Nocardioidaceae bacterium]
MSRLQVWRGGGDEGPLVLFLPGCPDSRWAAASGDLPARRAGVRLVGVNRPGYGETAPYDSDHLSVGDDLAELADELGADRFALLGMSIGGTYALACAARHPRRAAAVVTVAAPGDLTRMHPPHHRDGLSAQQAELLERVRSTGSVEQAMDLLRPEFEAYRRQALAELRSRDPVDPAVRQSLEALTCPDGYLRDAALTMRGWDWDPASVRCPVLVVHGELDEQASPRNAHWLAGVIPGARLRLLTGTNHLGALEESWEDVLTALRP